MADRFPSLEDFDSGGELCTRCVLVSCAYISLNPLTLDCVQHKPMFKTLPLTLPPMISLPERRQFLATMQTSLRPWRTATLSMPATTICSAAAARHPSSSSSFPTSQAPTRFVPPLPIPNSLEPQGPDSALRSRRQ